jgi:hypothetical protein
MLLVTCMQGCGVGVGVGNDFSVESESEGILGGVGVGKDFSVESESVKIYRLQLRPQSKILTRYSNSRGLIATVTIRLILKYRL